MTGAGYHHVHTEFAIAVGSISMFSACNQNHMWHMVVSVVLLLLCLFWTMAGIKHLGVEVTCSLEHSKNCIYCVIGRSFRGQLRRKSEDRLDQSEQASNNEHNSLQKTVWCRWDATRAE